MFFALRISLLKDFSQHLAKIRRCQMYVHNVNLLGRVNPKYYLFNKKNEGRSYGRKDQILIFQIVIWNEKQTLNISISRNLLVWANGSLMVSIRTSI